MSIYLASRKKRGRTAAAASVSLSLSLSLCMQSWRSSLSLASRLQNSSSFIASLIPETDLAGGGEEEEEEARSVARNIISFYEVFKAKFSLSSCSR